MRCFFFTHFLLQFFRNFLACFWATKQNEPRILGLSNRDLVSWPPQFEKYDIFHRKFESANLF